MMPDEAASFLATFPPILSALRMAGDGGMRIQLDIPESEMGEAAKLLLWRQMVLRVTVEPEADEPEWDKWDTRQQSGGDDPFSE